MRTPTFRTISLLAASALVAAMSSLALAQDTAPPPARETPRPEDIDPAVMGRNARLIQGLIVRAFVSEEPFADELKSEVELKGAESVGGEDCYQVSVKSEGQGESVWFISKRDFLPRRRDRVLVNPAGEKATREVVLSNLVVNAPPAGEPFKAVVPEGFKKTDDFAP